MFEDGDWVIFTRDNPDGGHHAGHKGMIVQLRHIGGFTFKHPQNGVMNVRPDICCRKLLVNESYMVLVSEHIGGGDWSDPWPAYMESLDQFRREVRDYEEEPEQYRILAKKKITTPYQDPNLDEILEEPVPAVNNGVRGVYMNRAVPAAPAADWAAAAIDAGNFRLGNWRALGGERVVPRVVARDDLLDLPAIPIEEEL